MCGHFGAASVSAFEPPHMLKAFSQGLFADTLRGEDSTGVAAIYSGYEYEEPEVFKKSWPAPDFIEHRRYRNIITDKRAIAALIGHNRAATQGSVNHDNAHPFTHSHITLAHNGTLTSMANLEGTYATDSERICYTMSKDGVISTLERLQGAYALVWHDSEEGTINFARNDQRTFAFCVSKDGKELYWASESKMLSWILDRNKIEHDTIMSPNPGTWFSFDLAQENFEAAKKTLRFTVYKAPVITTGFTKKSGYAKSSAVTSSGSVGETATGIHKGDLVACILDPADTGTTAPDVKDKRYHPTMETVKQTTAIGTPVKKVPVPVRCYGMLEKEYEDLFHGYSPDELLVVYGRVLSVYARNNDTQGCGYEAVVDNNSLWTACSLQEMLDSPKDYTWVEDVIWSQHGKQSLFFEGYPFDADEFDTLKLPAPEEKTVGWADDDDIPFGKSSDLAFYQGPSDTMIDADTCKKLLADGCVVCGDPLTLDDVLDEDVIWSDAGHPHCNSCVEEYAKAWN